MQTSGKTSTTVCLDEETTVVFSDSSDGDDSAEYSPEQSQAKGLRKNLKWALDYLIYDDEGKEQKKKRKPTNDDERKERNKGQLVNIAKKSDRRSVVGAHKNLKMKQGELGKSTHHVSNLSLNTDRSRSMNESKNAAMKHLEFELGKSTDHASNLTLNNTKRKMGKIKAYHKSNLPFYKSKKDLGKSTHHASNLGIPKMTHRREKGNISNHVSNLPLLTSKQNTKKKERKAYQSYSKRNRELEKDSQHVLNLTFQRRRDAIRGDGIGDEYESLITRRRELEAATEHASNLKMIASKQNTKR